MIGSAVRCSELVELATDWMEGSLDGVALGQLEEHLAVCPHCRSYVTQLRTSIGLLGETPREAPPASARAALLQAFREGVSPDGR